MPLQNSTDLPRHCTLPASEWRVLAQFWHPVAYSGEIQKELVSTTLLDEKLVLFRTAKGVVAARDLCLHRGAPLSLGWIEDDHLVCGFHGFKYKSSGECVRIPANPEATIPSRLCLTIYPTTERYGLVWVRLDRQNEPLAPLPDWPEIEQGNYQITQGPVTIWRASAGRHIENFNDLAHLPWVHTGTFGYREKPTIERYKVDDKGNRLSVRILEAIHQDRDIAGRRPDQICPVHYHYDVDLPFATKLLVDYLDGRHVYVFDVAAPISAGECRIFHFLGKNYGFEEDAKELIDYSMAVFEEDRPFVESQCPEELPLDLKTEVHIPADQLSIAYRKRLAAFGLGDQFCA